jgi:diguanylate cyclase (GGDEF)-like protein/PAS domain S-box-containing protein
MQRDVSLRVGGLTYCHILSILFIKGLLNLNVSIKKHREVTACDVHNQSRLQEKVFLEQMDILFKSLFISVPASLLCATIVFIALYRVAHTHELLYWFMATIFMSVFRLIFSGFYIHDHKCTKLRFYMFLFGTTIAAALWGFAGSFLMPDGHDIEQMIVIVIIAGVTAGGIQALQASLVASLIYINLIIIPLSIWLFIQYDIAYTILGFSMVLYLLFTVVISLRAYRFLTYTLRMKYENIALTEDVASTNKKLQQMNQDLIEKENNLRLIHDNAPIGMAIVSLDGKWLNVNNKLCDIVGYSKEELENLTIQEITYQDDLEIDLDNKAKLLSGKIQSYQIEKRYINKAHQLIWIVTNVSIVRGKGDKPLYYISQIQDINDRKQNENIIFELSHMNGMLQLCHESSAAYPIISHSAQKIFPELSGGLTIFNKLTNEQETVARWGESPLLKLFFKSEECWAFRSGNIYTVNILKKDSICSHFDTPPSGGYTCLPLIVQGQVLGMLHFNCSEGHTLTSYQQQIINNFSEIVKLSLANIHLNEVLREQAIHDPLTGLLNRRYLYECLPQMLLHALRAKHSLCVCMLDIDYFKRINDLYGHDAGDEVLKYIGTLLKNNIRGSDIACRFGGEEFVIVLIGTDLQPANITMEHIRMEVKNARIFVQNQHLLRITISIGVAEAPQHGENINDILHEADSALYAAKEAGRDKVVTAKKLK